MYHSRSTSSLSTQKDHHHRHRSSSGSSGGEGGLQVKDFGPFRYPSVQQAGSVRSAAASFHFPSDPSSSTLGSSQSTSDAEKLGVVASWFGVDSRMAAAVADFKAGKMDKVSTNLLLAAQLIKEADKKGASDPTWSRILLAKEESVNAEKQQKVRDVLSQRNEAKHGSSATPAAHRHEVRELESLWGEIRTLELGPRDPSTVHRLSVWAEKALEDSRYSPQKYQRALGRLKRDLVTKQTVKTHHATLEASSVKAFALLEQLNNNLEDRRDDAKQQYWKLKSKKAAVLDKAKDAQAREKRVAAMLDS